ncbi:hypothetical protein [Flagellimonas okinawensis]|uniref:Uncharacterized protein n=1 Tax=Flagellimonas okinawensis TaxID=3031324 RepID=A0ABT5XNF6_9FLAO|nr:hypothetical protein [[Muricauda] okinawensis]MDF0707423.1 hypothetical protein [[Muricauda] okinawensis]
MSSFCRAIIDFLLLFYHGKVQTAMEGFQKFKKPLFIFEETTDHFIIKSFIDDWYVLHIAEGARAK